MSILSNILALALGAYIYRLTVLPEVTFGNGIFVTVVAILWFVTLFINVVSDETLGTP